MDLIRVNFSILDDNIRIYKIDEPIFKIDLKDFDIDYVVDVRITNFVGVYQKTNFEYFEKERFLNIRAQCNLDTYSIDKITVEFYSKKHQRNLRLEKLGIN